MNRYAKIASTVAERRARDGGDASARNGAAAADSAATRPDGAPMLQTIERPRILLLDDEERILNALSALFRYKYQVFTATDGEQALAILKQCHVHVVISDQRMPAMTGIEFLRRAKVVSPNTVRVLLTGFSDLSAIIDSVNEGEVYRFLNKPWGNQEIQAVVGDAVGIGVALAAEAKRNGDAGQPSTASNAPTAPPSSRPAVVIMHERPEAFDQVRPLLADTQPLVHARTVEACIETLRTHNVAVIVSDIKVRNDDCTELLKLLKQEHPQILTIVLADSADADRVIDLINQAKIFRYVLSPCKPQKLKFFIDSALMHFQRSVINPTLLRQQAVEPPPAKSQSRAGAVIAARLRALRDLLSPRPMAK
jgi:serine/threonine-protein kinase